MNTLAQATHRIVRYPKNYKPNAVKRIWV